jgi:RNA polymerase sigma-70 factor (ECF subfamily)
MLADDVAVAGDGGGKVPAWTRPIVGVEHVGRLLVGLGGQIREHDGTIERREVNGQPGALIRDPDGRLVAVFSIEIVDGQVQRLRSVINPDKLHHLGPVADIQAALRQSR